MGLDLLTPLIFSWAGQTQQSPSQTGVRGAGWALDSHLAQGGLQLLEVSWEVSFSRQVLYGQEGGQGLDQVSCQVNVIGPQGDLRVTPDVCPPAYEQQAKHGSKPTTAAVPVRWQPC